MMTESALPMRLLQEVSGLVASRLGLHYPPDRYHDLLRALRPMLDESADENTENALAGFLATPLTQEILDRLASCLTIGETYFFRDRSLFKILEETVLPDFARRGGDRPYFRAWSAGCCTGEEAYSLAITLRQLFPAPEEMNHFILATDINPEFLRRAEAGRYRSWSFRSMPKKIQDVYFEQVGESEWRLSSEIRRMVTFSRLNLAEDPFPSIFNATVGHDLILCRNVLMYLHPQVAENALRKLHACLNEGGWLALAPSEFLLMGDYGYETVRFADTTLYRKSKGRRHGTVGAPPKDDRESGSDRRPETARTSDEARAARQGQDARTPSVRSSTATPPAPVGGFAWLIRAASELYAQGQYSEAAALLESHLATRSQNWDVTNEDHEITALLIRCLANSREYAKALAWCEQAIDADRLNARSHYLRATILNEMGRLDDAATALGNAIYLDPGFAAAHFMAGNMALSARHTGEALRHYRNVREMLSIMPSGETVPETDGMTSGEMIEMIDSIVAMTDLEVERVRGR